MKAKFFCRKHDVPLRGWPHWFCHLNANEAADGVEIWIESYNDMWCPSDGDGIIVYGECFSDDDWELEIVEG